jgi:uncharacterized integral membrane protein
VRRDLPGESGATGRAVIADFEGETMNTKVVVLLVAILLAVIVMLQNTAVTTIKLLLWSVSIPRILLIVILLLLGFVMGYMAATMKSKGGGE